MSDDLPSSAGSHEVMTDAPTTPAEEEPLERRTPSCSVCYDEPIGTALTPCFHAAFCNRCAVTIAFNHMPCPMCRSPVYGIQRIYFS